MSSINLNYGTVNQKGTPLLWTDIFANRPQAAIKGRLFFSTDTSEIYEDTGSAWTLIANVAGSGSVGTLEQVTTNGNSTDQGIVISANGLQTNSLNITSLTTGSVLFTDSSGLIQQDNTNFFWDDPNNRLGIGTNTPGAPLDIHNVNAGTTTVQINNTASSNAYIAFQQNSVGHWRIGNTAASNTFDILNNDLGNTPFSINNSNNNITALGTITTNGFIKSGGTSTQFLKADGSIDSNTYLTGNQTITLSGDVSGSGTTAITTTIGALKVTNAMLAGSIAASKLIGTDITTVGTLSAGSIPYSLLTGTPSSLAPTSGSTYYIQNTTSQQSSSNFNISGNGVIAGLLSVGGNIGLSITPPTWGSPFSNTVMQAGYTASFYGQTSSNAAFMGANIYYNGAVKYIQNGGISLLRLSDDYALQLQTAPSGTGGTIGTLTDIFNITPSGAATFASSVNSASSALQINPTNGYNLLIGTTTDAGYKLQVNGTASVTQIITSQTWVNASTFNQSFTISPANGAGTTIISNNSTNYTWTLEPATGNNRLYILRTIGSNTITINTSGADTIINNAGTSVSSLTMVAATGAIIIQADGSSRWLQIK